MLFVIKKLSLSYGVEALLDDAEFGIDAGERVALVGRNGAGKSTLMRIVSGETEPDHVRRESSPGLKIARLEQAVPANTRGTVFEVTADGLGDAGAAIARFHELTTRLSAGEDVMDALARAQSTVDTVDGWTLAQQVEATLSRLQLNPDADFSQLSGGLKRRVLLARALVSEPDLLLLDEPTNHLDIDTIAQLEDILLGLSGCTLLFITHDRAFLRKLATRIVDLDRGKLTSWPGNYDQFLADKDKALADEQKANALFDKRLAQEEIWIRQGIKARRTRNEGRVRALKAMRVERAQRRERTDTAKIVTPDTSRSGKEVIVTRDLSYARGDTPIVANLTTTIVRGDKVGIIGPNGAGKTTLIKLLLGQLTPDSGTIKLGTNLEIAHFDQHRAAIDDNISVLDNVAGGRSSVNINGKDLHVISYMQDFLFSPKRARSPTHVLSGGERNRLLLAKLFTRPANLLVMDEPTNDLDVETLELLEERLTDYKGTLLLVSHDRDFLDHIVTSSLVMEGNGHVGEYVGGYSDYLRQRPAQPQKTATTSKVKRPKPKPPCPLSSAERRELTNLPRQIDQLEAELDTQRATFAEPAFYERDADDIAKATAAYAALETKLESALLRWEKLESKKDLT